MKANRESEFTCSIMVINVIMTIISHIVSEHGHLNIKCVHCNLST